MKRLREEEEEKWDNEKIRERILRIGDKTGLEAQLDALIDGIHQNFEAAKAITTSTILECASCLTVKTPIYCTLVSLLARSESQWANELVAEALKSIEQYITSSQWPRVELLTRFIVGLANTNFIDAEDIAQFLLTIIRESDTSNRQRADTFVMLALGALPWVGKTLQDKAPTQLATVIDTLRRYINERKAPRSGQVYMEGSGATIDYLDVMWSRIENFVATDYVATVTLKPYNNYESTLLDLNKDNDNNKDRRLPSFQVPSHSDTTTYMDKPAALHLFYPWNDSKHTTDENLISPGEHDARDPDVAHFHDRFKIKPIDRLVAEQYIAETLYFWNNGREECIKKLRLFPIKHQYEHIVVESLLSHMFAFPRPVFSSAYYMALLVDLCKVDPNYPVVVAEAIEIMYDRVPQMDAETCDRFVQWFAFHLANFGYRWFWEDWSGTKEDEKVGDSTCKKLFIHETFSQMLRHSYRERLNECIHQVFHRLVPEPPRPQFKWDSKRLGKDKQPPPFRHAAESIFNNIKTGQFTSDEVTLELDRQDWNNEMTAEDKIEILMHCILATGIETITHQRNALSKFKDSFEAIITTAMQGKEGDERTSMSLDLRLKIISSACAFWDNSPQHKLIVLRQLLDLQIVEQVNIVQWIFSAGVVSYWERAFPWEALRMTLDELITEFMDGCGLLHDLTTKEEPTETDTKQAKRLENILQTLLDQWRLCVYEVFSKFNAKLTEYYNKLDERQQKQDVDQRALQRDMAKDIVWGRSAVSHFAEVGRKYITFFRPWWRDIMENIFSNCDQRMLPIINSWQELDHLRWCSDSGYVSLSKAHAMNKYLELVNAGSSVNMESE